MSFFTELKRRNVFKVAIAYAIVAWLIIQIIATVFPILALPDWTVRFITIVIIIGFPLAVILAWIYELTPEGIKVTTSEGPAQYHTQTTGQRLNYFIIGVLVLVVVFLLSKVYVLKESPEVTSKTPGISVVTETVTPEKVVQEKAEPAATSNSIAVLPFKNMSSDPEQEYFADGIAEEILNSLARIKDLEVRGRTSSFYFKGRNEDLPTISRMLNVNYLLEGSVRKEGNHVRITVQLINVLKDEHLWSKTYDRTLKDIFDIQENIAKSIADTLQISLGVGELGRTPGMTRNVEAYEAFLAGRSLFYKFDRENISRSLEKLEQAVALDPDFAVGWSLLAGVYSVAGDIFIPEKVDEYSAKRDAARNRVIELVPEADYALRIKAQQSGNLAEVERLYKRALAQDPEDHDTNLFYGRFLRDVGRPKQAIDYIQRAIRVDPLYVGPYFLLGVCYENSGNLTAAAATYTKGGELSNDPALSNMALLGLALDANDRARIEEFFASTPSPENYNDTYRKLGEVIRALLDKPEDAGTRLRQLLSEPAYANSNNRQTVAAWAAYFGQYELALEIWQEVSNPDGSWRPIFKGMRRLPGYKDLVTKAGLVDYWRVTGNWGEFCHPVGGDNFECN